MIWVTDLVSVSAIKHILCVTSRFTDLGVDTIEDAIDVELVSDEVLKVDIGLTDDQILQFRE